MSALNRRHFLKHVAGYSALALPGIEFVRTMQANAQELRRQNKSVIILWMAGGPATIDIWDMKPGQPTGGEHKPKPTAASGVQITEHMPNTAKQFKNLSIVRSLSTREGDHNRGTFMMNSGRSPSPLIDYP